MEAGVGADDAADAARFEREDLVLEHLRQLAAADVTDLAAFLRVRRERVLARQLFERAALLQLRGDLIRDRLVVYEDLFDVQLLATAELSRMLLVVRANLGVGRRRDVFGLIADQLLPPHLVALFDDGDAGVIADGRGDPLRRNLDTVRRRVFGEDHFL